ncbi:MAG: VacJ family lipoprotein [Gammaproteobacteria bacterium]|jgi:phospholipid-binding lipoprotein MlaA
MSVANDRAQTRIKSISKAARIIILISTLTASAVFAEERETQNVDPFEAINRPIYKFNDITDKFLLRPLGKGYNFITPRPVRTGIGNFYDNITYPVTIVNSLLQGKGTQAIYDLNRFLFNSVFGVLGFVDVASSRGFPRHDEDFGQTFAKWSIPQGPYIVIPLLGPSTVRDGIGILGNVRVNPLIQMDNSSVRDKLLILWTVETRAALIGPDELVQDAFDPYLFVRDAYLQNRQFLINDSTTPTDEFFEDFEEDF